MTMMDMTNVKLARLTGHAVTEIPEIYVHVAKYEILTKSGPEGIADILGVTPENVTEVQQNHVYRDIRLVLATEYARSEIERDVSYDALEELALGKLVKVAQFESDVDTLIRIATMANRAERRAKPKESQPLDPRSASTRVPLKLSERIVRKINYDGSQEETRERQISVMDGSAKNPTFAQIEEALMPTPMESPQGRVEGTTNLASDSTTYNPLTGDPDSKIPTLEDGLRAVVAGQLTPGAKDKLRALAEKATRHLNGDKQ